MVLPHVKEPMFFNKGKTSKWVRGPDEGGIQLFSPQYLSYYSTYPYDVGTQNNRLTETILLSTHNIGFKVKITILNLQNAAYLEH